MIVKFKSWYLGHPDENCHETCKRNELFCEEYDLFLNNKDVSNSEKLLNLLRTFILTDVENFNEKKDSHFFLSSQYFAEYVEKLDHCDGNFYQ